MTETGEYQIPPKYRVDPDSLGKSYSKLYYLPELSLLALRRALQASLYMADFYREVFIFPEKKPVSKRIKEVMNTGGIAGKDIFLGQDVIEKQPLDTRLILSSPQNGLMFFSNIAANPKEIRPKLTLVGPKGSFIVEHNIDDDMLNFPRVQFGNAGVHECGDFTRYVRPPGEISGWKEHLARWADWKPDGNPSISPGNDNACREISGQVYRGVSQNLGVPIVGPRLAPGSRLLMGYPEFTQTMVQMAELCEGALTAVNTEVMKTFGKPF